MLVATIKGNFPSEKLESIKARHTELEQMLSDPKIYTQRDQFREYAQERAALEDMVQAYDAYLRIGQKCEETQQLVSDQTLEPELREMAESELRELEAQSDALEETIHKLLIPRDPRDERNLFLEIRAGTGGEEASLFAGDLLRMYTRYAEGRKWRVEMVHRHDIGIGGFKEVTLLIEGKGAFSHLKFESGVHRVQRVPITETSGRIHTSAVTVAVLPEAEEIELKIASKDLRIDTYCSTGPGGQSVNTTYSAIRITHLPTGQVVTIQDEKSQIKNKAKAMRVLRSRLLEAEQAKQDAERSENRKSQVGTGDRSEKIRTYNFPQNRVTEHRTGLTLHKLEEVLNGDLDAIIENLIAHHQAIQLGTHTKQS